MLGVFCWLVYRYVYIVVCVLCYLTRFDVTVSWYYSFRSFTSGCGVVMGLNVGVALEGLYWVFFGMAFWGAFELAVQAPCDPVWSGTWGYPVPHHYIVGFCGLALIRVLKWFKARNGES